MADVVDEHFVPVHGLDLEPYLASGDLCGVHHLIRYIWAVECIGDLAGARTVLDMACGAGYGSYAIASRYPHLKVVGADYDPHAVEAARAAYSLPNLEFRVGDGTEWEKTLGAEAFDCVVSFETIEHVSHRELFMENLVEHLSPDGSLLLSTPCGSYTNEHHPDWAYHKIEYSFASLYDMLSRYFGEILRPDAGTLPHVDVFDALKGTSVVYLLMLNPVLCRRPIRIPNPYPRG
jgi:SAM-dependent methyltransferase